MKRRTTTRLGCLTNGKPRTHLKPKLILLLSCLHLGVGVDCLAASEPANVPPAEQGRPAIVPGATELSPSRSQYFSWINNRNEGSTEAQTLADLEFFKWLHDAYGMQLDICAFDAGNIDGPRYYGRTDTEKSKAQFPRGVAPMERRLIAAVLEMPVGEPPSITVHRRWPGRSPPRDGSRHGRSVAMAWCRP